MENLGEGGAAATGWRNRTAVELVQETLEVEPKQSTKLPGEWTVRKELVAAPFC